MMIELRGQDDQGFDVAPLECAQVAYIQLTVQLEIAILDATRDALEITISTPFCVGESEDALSEPIDPEKNDPRIGEVILRLRFKTLTKCRIDPDCTLKLTFDDGFVVVIGPDPLYEAWDIEHKKFKIVGAAGGGFAIWDH
jgi:hypothetical protein